MKDEGFSIALWNLIGTEVNVVTVDGKPLTRRALKDNEWEIAEWDINRALTVNKGLFDKAPLAVDEVKEGKKTLLVMANGLTLPEENVLSVKIFGKMVQKSEDSAQVAAKMRSKIADVFKPMVADFAEELAKIDAQLPKDKDPKKAGTLKLANAAIDKFRADAEEAIIKSAMEQWIIMLDANVDYRDFKIDTAVSLTKGVITLTLGIASAAAGGITGVGAVLGLVGTIKGGLETATTAYMAFRNVEGLGEELNKVLAASVAAKSAVGWQNFGKTVLGKLPGGTVVQAALSKGGVAAKPASDIEKDLKTYNGKVSGLQVNAKDLGKKVEDVLKKSDEALKALETQEVKAAEAKNPEVKKSNDKKRKLIGDATTNFLDKIGDLSQRFEKGKENVERYNKLLEILKDKVKEDKIAGFLTTYFTPLLDLPWGVDPENLRATLQTVGTIGLDLAGSVLSDLKLTGETGDQVKEWSKFANDTVNALKSIQETLKK
jgi:hypothetical protein